MDTDWLAAYEFSLPPEQIAQFPCAPRDHSRLMVLRRGQGGTQPALFRQLPALLPPNSLVVANDARVQPYRLVGTLSGGARIECLLLARNAQQHWHALVRKARRLRPGTLLVFAGGHIRARAIAPAEGETGGWWLAFEAPETLDERMERYGLAPLPPYIRRAAQPSVGAEASQAGEPRGEFRLNAQQQADRQAYQTCYAQTPGASAAPTAGLHFTPRVLRALRERGCGWLALTLQVGLGTFAPLRGDGPPPQALHREWVELSAQAAASLLAAREQRRPLIAIGSTSVRALETWSAAGCPKEGFAGWSTLFIRPGYRFRLVQGLLTNFHLPRTTLLMLICAFHGTAQTLAAYRQAVEAGYRFYSFGDCMLILPHEQLVKNSGE